MIKVIGYIKPSLNLIIVLNILAVVVGIMALAMSIFTPRAHAYEINILADRNLMVGSTGQNVVVLQGLLSELGYLNVPVSTPLGYFGSLTKSAVAQYQLSRGILSATGYFGPQSKIAMHEQFSSRGWLPMMGW
jgi:peptidoglycan hydrolase-like protein with peptidoglycan-binding domain